MHTRSLLQVSDISTKDNSAGAVKNLWVCVHL